MGATVTISPTDQLTGRRRHYEVAIDGVKRGEVRLEHYFPPATRTYDDGDVAIWAGRDVAFGSLTGSWRQIELPEPLLDVYRLRAGWLAVAEISVYLLNQDLEVVIRRIHHEVLMSSSWSAGQLVVHDFAGRVLQLDIDQDELSAGDFIPRRPAS